MKRITKYLIILWSLVLLVLSSPLMGFGVNKDYRVLPENPLESNSWIITPIIIDDSDPLRNWSRTELLYDWCSGAGTWNDPYIIENVTINGNNVASCIEIRHSDAFFEIKNSILFNGANVWGDGAIRLLDVKNGYFYNNSITNSSHGIYIQECMYLNITENYVSNNDIGISLAYANYSSIVENEINLIDNDAIKISQSVNNSIINNTILDINYKGIELDHCINTTISGNIINNARYDGISCYSSRDCVILNNTANNQDTGIEIINCISMVLRKNSMNNNGLYLDGNTMVELDSHIIDTSNHVNGRILYYYVDQPGLVSANFTDAGQLYLVKCNHSKINNLNVSYSSYGIVCYNCENNTISKNLANHSEVGILLSQSFNCNITDNIASKNKYYGITVYECENIKFFNNTLNDDESSGIYISYSKNTYLAENKFNHCGLEVWGPAQDYGSHTIDTTNLVNGKLLYYHVNKTGLNQFPNAGQIILVNCYNSLISGVNTSESSVGINLYLCTNISVINSLSSQNKYGIVLDSSNYSRIMDNTANDNEDWGIIIHQSSETTVFNNVAMNNNYYGIFLYQSEYNNISNNLINNNSVGIHLGWANHNNITENIANSNQDTGFQIYESDFNFISKNNISNNIIDGMFFRYSDYNIVNENNINYNQRGIYMSISNNYNTITRNNLVGNYEYCLYNSSDCIGNQFIDNICDHDADGIDDSWENAHGLNPDLNDANMDNDGDGLINLFEYYHDTDPFDSDTDDDQMPDGWEVSNSLNPKADDSLGDPDGDFLLNIQELQYGTDPHDSDSDDDNLEDNVEVNIYSTDPADPDTDNDGYNDGEEVQAGTDPLNPNDYPGQTEPSIPGYPIIIIAILIMVFSLISSKRLEISKK